MSLANPVLYMVNAFRYGLLGVSDIPLFVAFGLILGFIVAFSAGQPDSIASAESASNTDCWTSHAMGMLESLANTPVKQLTRKVLGPDIGRRRPPRWAIRLNPDSTAGRGDSMANKQRQRGSGQA
jgi:hypothetical protein